MLCYLLGNEKPQDNKIQGESEILSRVRCSPAKAAQVALVAPNEVRVTNDTRAALAGEQRSSDRISGRLEFCCPWVSHYWVGI